MSFSLNEAMHPCSEEYTSLGLRPRSQERLTSPQDRRAVAGSSAGGPARALVRRKAMTAMELYRLVEVQWEQQSGKQPPGAP